MDSPSISGQSGSAPQPLAPSWMQRLGDEFNKPYMNSLREFLAAEIKSKKVIFPAKDQIFKALNVMAIDEVRVVILGQDPYHGAGQAHGLSFSVPAGAAIPPSLVNIYKEIQRDLSLPMPRHGNLESWAKQGVLLLNSVLTVQMGHAASHQGKGWETFTDRIIEELSLDKRPKVFMLWGSYAARKGEAIHRLGPQHLVLKAPHPSPLSAHRGFMGSGHFSKANKFLIDAGQQPIDWSNP